MIRRQSAADSQGSQRTIEYGMVSAPDACFNARQALDTSASLKGQKMPGRRICTIPNCSNYRVGRGFCDMHYRRWKRHGDPLNGGPQLGAPLVFMEQAISTETEECVIWPFALNNSGYGSLAVDGKSIGAHRYACECANGPPPSPQHEAAHSCNNRPCINGKHLRWATKVENEADTLVHGTRSVGEKHGISKLTEDQVREIRALSGKMLQHEIADLYGVTQTTISCIVRGQTWGWLA